MIIFPWPILIALTTASSDLPPSPPLPQIQTTAPGVPSPLQGFNTSQQELILIIHSFYFYTHVMAPPPN